MNKAFKKTNLEIIENLSYQNSENKFFKFNEEFSDNLILIFSLNNCPSCVKLQHTLENVIENKEVKEMNVTVLTINISEQLEKNPKETQNICVDKLKITKVPDWFLLKKEDKKYKIISRFVGSRTYAEILKEMRNFSFPEDFLNC